MPGVQDIAIVTGAEYVAKDLGMKVQLHDLCSGVALCGMSNGAAVQASAILRGSGGYAGVQAV